MNQVQFHSIMLTISLCAGGVVFVTGCAQFDPIRGFYGSYRNYTQVSGTIRNNRYSSPEGNFSCEVPPLLSPGAIIRDKIYKIDGNPSGEVIFSDDTGSRWQVHWMEIPKGMVSKEVLQEAPIYKKEVEKNFKAITQNERVSGSIESPSYFYMFRIPKGDLLGLNLHRLDTEAVSELFCESNFFYIASYERPIFDISQTTAQRETNLMSKLDMVLGGSEYN